MKFITIMGPFFKTPVFCLQNIYVLNTKHRCFETAVRIYFMKQVIVLEKGLSLRYNYISTPMKISN